MFNINSLKIARVVQWTGVAGPLGNAGAEDSLELFLGNAGTAMRPLCAALCLGEGEYVLTGEPRMEERPIGSW